MWAQRHECDNKETSENLTSVWELMCEHQESVWEVSGMDGQMEEMQTLILMLFGANSSVVYCQNLLQEVKDDFIIDVNMPNFW